MARKIAPELVRTALITGGARRVGAAIALDLGRHGYRVAVHYNASRRAAHKLVAEIAVTGGMAAAFAADLNDPDATAALFDEVRAALGPVNVLVNNASVFEPDTARTPDWRAWARHFDVHVRAPAQLAAAFARQKEIKSGLIVNMIDQRVLRLNPRFFSYTLSKSALWAATQIMAQEFAPKIRVNAISPGPSLPNPRQGKADFRRQIAGLLLKRGPELEDFGRAIRFLDETRSITGQMIALDGGQHLAWETPDIAGISE